MPKIRTDTRPNVQARRAVNAQRAIHAVIAVAAVTLTAWSAIYVKEKSITTPLAATVSRSAATAHAEHPVAPQTISPEDLAALEAATIERPGADAVTSTVPDGAVRWFDGKRVRPVRTIWMKVTAYSPDARSCGKWADGQTATLHSVWTNGMRLVAADTKVLPYRSMITVPGYADDQIVPVLDCGGAIKGMRLDVLMPTHRIARKWGVRSLPITVWAYDEED